MKQAAYWYMVFRNSVFRKTKRCRLPEVENVKSLGVKIETNVVIGKTVTIDELMEERRI